MCYICDEEKGVENTNLEGPNGQIFLCPKCRATVTELIYKMVLMEAGSLRGVSLTIHEDYELQKNHTKLCKYPVCTYYDPKAKSYCCNACAGDHYDYDRLQKERDKKESFLVNPDLCLQGIRCKYPKCHNYHHKAKRYCRGECAIQGETL